MKNPKFNSDLENFVFVRKTAVSELRIGEKTNRPCPGRTAEPIPEGACFHSDIYSTDTVDHSPERNLVMKFKFCSDGDCPLWALAALHALGTLPAPLFRNLLQHIVEEQPDDGIMEILKDTSLSSREECALAAAVIRWVLTQAWRCACTGSALTKDLLVLGLGRAHATALAEAADAGREAYVTHVENNGFMVNKVMGVSVSAGPEGAIDTVQLTMHVDDVFTGEQNRKELLIEKSQIKNLVEELKLAYKKMEQLEEE